MVTSEGDMAQADETGDEEGRSDDGFVEGSDPGGSGRRRKKRQPGNIIIKYQPRNFTDYLFDVMYMYVHVVPNLLVNRSQGVSAFLHVIVVSTLISSGLYPFVSFFGKQKHVHIQYVGTFIYIYY